MAATATTEEAAADLPAEMVLIEEVIEEMIITEMGPIIGAEKETVDKSTARNIQTPQWNPVTLLFECERLNRVS